MSYCLVMNISYRIMNLAYAAKDNATDFTIRFIFDHLADFSDNISKQLNDGVQRSKEEYLSEMRDRLSYVAIADAKSFDLDEDQTNQIVREVESWTNPNNF